jgi:hypothetical protein
LEKALKAFDEINKGRIEHQFDQSDPVARITTS